MRSVRLLGKEENGFGRRGGEAVGVCMVVVVHGGYPRPAQDDHLFVRVRGRGRSLSPCLFFFLSLVDLVFSFSATKKI